MADWRVGAARDLPIAQTDRAWDGDAARRRIFEWAGWPDNPDPARARRAFLVYDAERAGEKGAYKLPFADIVDDELRAIPSGLRAAASRLPQADLPAEVKARARQVLDAYFERLRKSAKAGALRVKVAVSGGAKAAGPTGERAKRLKPWGALSDTGHLVLGLPFGGPHDGRDADGEAFHEGTDTWLRIGDEVPVTYYHGFGPDAPGEWQERPAVIGLAKLVRVDERGHWFRVRYDPDEPLAQRVMGAPLDALRASSGAVAHLVRVRPDGLIDTWPVGELAVFDVNDWRQPANDWAVVVPAEVEAEATAKARESAEAGAVLEADAGERETVKSQSQTEGTTVTEKIETQATEQVAVQADMDIQAVIERAVQAAAEAAAAKALQAVAAEPPVNTGAAVVAQKRVMVNTGGDDYRAKFDAWLKRRLPLEALGAKALTEGGTGSALVPVEYGDELLRNLTEDALMRRAGARVVTQGVLTSKWPKLGSATAASGPIPEEGAYSEVTPTTSEVTVTLYKYGAIAKVTEEVLADSRFDVWGGLLAPYFSEFFALTENEAFTNGSGSGEPQGVLNAQVGVTTASGTAITADEIIDLFHSLDYKYRASAVWMMNDSTAAAIRKLKDSNGQYLWQPGLAAGQPDMLLGRPVITNNHIPAIGLNAKVIVFGDFRYYWIFQHPDTTAQRLEELYAATGHIGFRVNRRFSGYIMNDNAFRVLQMAAA